MAEWESGNKKIIKLLYANRMGDSSDGLKKSLQKVLRWLDGD